jgi:hypothetical protein
MRIFRGTFPLAILLAALAFPALAQMERPMNNAPTEQDPTSNAQSDFDKRLRDAQARQRVELARHETPEQSMTAAGDLAKTLNLACDIKDAAPVATGPATVNGKHVQTKTYEVACGNGMGYLLVSQETEAPAGFSCFAAEGQRVIASEKGQKFSDVCQLTANKDMLALATAVLAHAGTSCAVTKLRWVGQSLASKVEYDEVACGDGKGYMLATAMVGAPAVPRAFGCSEAAAHGLPCQLTSAPAAALPTLDDFKQALVQHGIVCTAANIRVIGKEQVHQRHVVEFQCPERPAGLVAFIPLAGNTSPFEALDCPAAALRGAVCKFPAASPASPH